MNHRKASGRVIFCWRQLVAFRRKQIGWRFVFLIGVICGMVLVGTESAQAGKLSRAGDAVREDKPSSSSSRSNSHPCDDDDDESIVGSLIGDMISHMLFGDGTPREEEEISEQTERERRRLDIVYTPYPYFEDSHSYAKSWVDETPPDDHHRARFQVEYGDDYESMQRISSSLLYDNADHWGIDTSWTTYQERLPMGGTDEASLGDLNLLASITTENSHFRFGGGLNWFDDDFGTEIGGNLTVVHDYYFCRPFVLTTEIDWGKIGSAEIFHGRSTVGVLWKNIEGYAGYDYVDLGGVPLKSTVFGVRVWF